MSRLEGVVLWFNNSKGYGFVGAEGTPDVFCHHSALENEGYKSLSKADVVSFEIETGSTGRPQAAPVRLIRSSEVA